MGWECKACRDDNRKELKALLVEVRKLRDDLAHSSAAVQDANPDLDPSDIVLPANPMLVGNVSMPSESSSRRGTSVLYTDVLKIVNRSIKDVTFRKRNVIVSGLMETNNSTDESLFLNLCEDHLRVKPHLEPNATRRLGKSDASISKPRQLLVRLGSEATATDVLRAARSLRNSDDSYVANNVYINEDLSKEEAKAAFEKRQRKRQTRNGDEDVRVGTDAVINSVYRRNVGSGAHASELGSTEPQSPLTSRPSGSRIFSNSNLNSNCYSMRSAVCRSNLSNLIICSDSDQTVRDDSEVLGSSTRVACDRGVSYPLVTDLNPNATSFQPPLAAAALYATVNTTDISPIDHVIESDGLKQA